MTQNILCDFLQKDKRSDDYRSTDTGQRGDPREYFFADGKCVSHTLFFADGSRKTVGVILPSTLVFNTGTAEVMEGVWGSCEYRLDGSQAWQTSAVGEKFSVPANTRFEIRSAEGYHYICHFG